MRDFIRVILDGDHNDAEKPESESEEDLLVKAQRAVKELAESGEPITHKSVSLRLGIPPWTVSLYPALKRFIQQHVDYASQQFKQSEKQEQALLEKVRSAIDDLKRRKQPVTYNAVSRILGIHHVGWKVYAQVRAFVDQNLDSKYLDTLRKQGEREELLLPRVEEAIRQLEVQGEPVRFQGIGKILGIHPSTLKAYPRVSVLIEQKGDTSLRKRRPGRSEEEMLIKVQMTIQELTSRGQGVTYRSVAREMGIAPDNLKTYAQIKVLLEEHLRLYQVYERQQFSLREEALLGQVEGAIAELEALDIPVTQRAICARIGQRRFVLKYYPRIKAVIVRKASAYHALQRRAAHLAEEEEIMQKVEEAVANLKSLGEPVTQTSIARYLKKSPTVLGKYPQVVAYLEQHGYKRQQGRAENLTGCVKEAIQLCKTNGRPITVRELCLIVGIKSSTLTYYPSVGALITQAINEDRRQRQKIRFQEREEELSRQVVDAIQHLQERGKRVSVRAVGISLHVSPECLPHYPRVRYLLQKAIEEQHSSNNEAQHDAD